MVVQLGNKYRIRTTLTCHWLSALLVGLLAGVLLFSSSAYCGGLRKELQRTYDRYKKSELHYKVFALKHEGNRWDGWYTFGYNDLDQAILDAIKECNKGTNVSGQCQVYGLGNEVVVGLEPLQLQGKIEEYRISGMVNRAYPKPVGGKLTRLGFSGNGKYFAGVVADQSKPRLFIYDTSDALWKYTTHVSTDLKLQAGRSFDLSEDGKMYAFARYMRADSDKGKSSLVVKGWDSQSLVEIPLKNGAFWNGGCGVALSPSSREVAVCVDDGVVTRILRYDVRSGQKIGELDSAKLKGKFDRSLEYSPDGKFLLVRGGRYQFDWVLKKKGKEAELVWVFSTETGALEKSLEFLLGPGLRGPESIGFSVTGHTIIVATTRSISLYGLGREKTKKIARQLSENARVLLSPYGVLAIVQGAEFTRFNIIGESLVLIDEDQVGLDNYVIGFDHDDRWLLVGRDDIKSFSAFRQGDLQSIALYQSAKKMFDNGSNNEGMNTLAMIFEKNHRLPVGFSVHNYYKKYSGIPLASFGLLYGTNVQGILETSPKVSRLGFGYVKDPESGLFFTTIERIDPGTSAARSSLQIGDRITHLNGKPVVLSTHMSELLAPLVPGSRVELTFMRNGRIFQSRVVTEIGFKDTGKAAHVLLSLFDYGQLAAQAGHPGLTRLAAVRLRAISGKFPSSFRTDLVEKLALSLEALAFGTEGDLATGFELLAKSAPHPFQFRLFNTLVWGDFYSDRIKMAEALGVSENKLPKFNGNNIKENQDFPDLNGVLIPAIVSPILLR